MSGRHAGSLPVYRSISTLGRRDALRPARMMVSMSRLVRCIRSHCFCTSPMLRGVGQLDQFAKDTFALETASVTHGAAAWQLAPELNMSEVRLDGLLLVHAPALLAPLAPPWSTVQEPGELVLEIKMPGDHVDMLAIAR